MIEINAISRSGSSSPVKKGEGDEGLQYSEKTEQEKTVLGRSTITTHTIG